MSIETGCRWHLRSNGGINIGLRLHFPGTVIDEEGTCRVWLISIGLIAFTIDINIQTHHTKHK